jgi:hypothetical protein
VKPIVAQSELPNYHVEAGRDQVEAWSVTRLPFEPRGWLKAFREDLRTAIGLLTVTPGHILRAVYGSHLLDLCDTENVVFYNVGASVFAASAKNGLRFERAYRLGRPCPQPLSNRPLHYHAYFVDTADATFKHWKVGRTFARWSFPCNAQLIGRCASTWYAMKQARIVVSGKDESPPEKFGLRLVLTVPLEARVLPANAIQPLFDGVIAAFHQHVGDNLAEISRRLASQLGVEAGIISKYLMASGISVLGQRPLVHLYGTTVQWNPQDEACMVGELIIYRGEVQREWLFSGELIEVVEM